MRNEEREARITIPELLSDGTNAANGHFARDEAPTNYAALGQIGGLRADDRRTKDWAMSKNVIGSTAPDTAFNRISSIGNNVINEHHTDTLLASLPPSYDNTSSSLSASARPGSRSVTSDTFQPFIIDEFERRTSQTKNKDTKDGAFAADKNKYRRGNVECCNCRKRGHVKADCWAKGGDKVGQRPKGNCGRARAVAAATTDEVGIGAWAAIEVQRADEDDWATRSTKDISGSGIMETETDESDAEPRGAQLYGSAASRHMSPYRSLFVSYRSISPRAIKTANSRTFYAVGIGDLRIQVPNGGSFTTVHLRDALHAPDLGATIISIRRITEDGHSVTFEGDSCKVRNERGNVIANIPADANGLYKVEHGHATLATQDRIGLSLHCRLGHIAPDEIRALLKSHAVEGIQLTDDNAPFTCESCEYAKRMHKHIRKERAAPLAAVYGAEVHTDVWGPSPIASLGGRKYYVTFTDDHTRYTRVQILRTKEEAFAAYKVFAAWAETQYGRRIQRLRSDRGAEFTGSQFTKLLQEQGTEQRLTALDTPQHNGVAESLNRRLVERVSATLRHTGLPKSLWAEALHFIVWLKNRTSTHALGSITTPYERLTGQKPNLAGLPEWGQRVWVHSDRGNKLEARATVARWVGYDSDSIHAHRIYWPEKGKVTVERNIGLAAEEVKNPPPRSHSQPMPTREPAASTQPSTSTPFARTRKTIASTTSKSSARNLQPRSRRQPRASSVWPPAVTESNEEELRHREMGEHTRKIAKSEGSAGNADSSTPLGGPATSGQGEEVAGGCITKDHTTDSDPGAGKLAFQAHHEDFVTTTAQDAGGNTELQREAEAPPDQPHWRGTIGGGRRTIAKFKSRLVARIHSITRH